MKKLLSGFLALVLIFTLSACKPSATPADTQKDFPAFSEATIDTSTEMPTEDSVDASTAPNAEAPTEEPTETPTQAPAVEPTKAPTKAPAVEPTKAPTKAPAAEPTEAPTEAPAVEPTEAPTEAPAVEPTEAPTEAPTESRLDPNGSYTTKEDVALYIHQYGHLPPNFITKAESKRLGGTPSGKCIGGDTFQNREGLLPKAPGRTYTECDIDTLYTTSRGKKRIVFSNDGLIFYTGDHYKSFEQLYGGK